MRQIVLDTETTGLDPEAGHRIIEVACVELEDRLHTGRTLHHYVNPGRRIDAGAQDVHGIGDEQLADKPPFAEIAAELREFVSGSEVIIHNAPFDVAFLDAEYVRISASHGSIRDWCEVLDTLVLAREIYPGQANSLDALCRRHHVDNSGREYHGALLDAQLLADVYLAMTGGQVALALESGRVTPKAGSATESVLHRRALPQVTVSAAERKAHRERLAAIRSRSGLCLWDAIDAEPRE